MSLWDKIRIFVGRTCILSGCVVNAGRAASPSLTHVFPAGGQRGATVKLNCYGEFSWPVGLSASGLDVVAGEAKGTYTITIPPDLWADRVWLRLHNDQGVSKLLPFLVGSLPEVLEAEPNDAPSSAQDLSRLAAPPGDARLTINGVLQKNDDVDVFLVSLSQGQTLVAAVDANHAFGSPMDSILQVTTADGTVLAENHDDVGLDSRLAFTAPETGRYLVRVFAFPAQPDQTIAFRGGDDYVYRLTLTTGPYLTHADSLTVNSADGMPGTVKVRGWNVPPGTCLPVNFLPSLGCFGVELESLPGIQGVEGRIGLVQAPDWAGGVRVRCVAFPVTEARKDAPSQGSFTELSPPQATSGCIGAPGQTDVFSLQLEKDVPIRLAVESTTLASLLVPHVQLMSPDGEVVAAVDESGTARDASLDHTPATSGSYQLRIRDRFGHGGKRYFYRVTVVPRPVTFSMSVDMDAVTMSDETPLELSVNIQRQDLPGQKVGPITVTAMGLPPSVHVEPAVSSTEGESAGKVTLVFTSKGEAFCGPIRIQGDSDSPQLRRFARTPPQWGACFEHIWLTVPPR